MSKKSTKKQAPKASTEKRESAEDAVHRSLGQRPPRSEFFPTRNDALNVHLRGGWLVGAANMIYGNPALFKSTMVAECIADAIRSGAHAIVFDREERLNHDRLRGVGTDVDSPNLHYYYNQPYTLTVERVFRFAAGAVQRIRAQDAARVAAAIESGERSAGEYAERMQGVASEKKKVAQRLRDFPHLLLPSDKTLIIWAVDSVTATPASPELTTGGSSDSSNPTVCEDALEAAIRAHEDPSARLGMTAQAWSSQFRTCTVFDEKVCGLFTAQMRVNGIGQGNAFLDAAVGNATKFYARVILHVSALFDSEGAGVFRDQSGALFFAPIGEVGGARTETLVGRRLLIKAKKTATGHEFEVPAFMVGAYGTDRPNSLWEFFKLRGVIEHHHQGRYRIAEQWATHASELKDEKFSRPQFVSELYAQHAAVWRALLYARASVETPV